jgi:hypothetical protein
VHITNVQQRVSDHQLRYPRVVTSKQRLHQLVDSLPEDQADELLRLATDLYAEPSPHRLPAFVGIGDSGRSDVSERADELRQDGFGR